MVNDNGMINGQYSIKDHQGSFFVNGHYSSHINETNFCLEFYLEMVQTLFCACPLYKPLLCAYGTGVNAGGFAIGGLKRFKYYIISQLSYMTLVVLHTY